MDHHLLVETSLFHDTVLLFIINYVGILLTYANIFPLLGLLMFPILLCIFYMNISSSETRVSVCGLMIRYHTATIFFTFVSVALYTHTYRDVLPYGLIQGIFLCNRIIFTKIQQSYRLLRVYKPFFTIIELHHRIKTAAVA